MYNFLSDPLINKIVRLLREQADKNPAYRRISPHILDSFSYAEVPQEGVYVEDVSATHQPLAAHNFVGHAYSHVFAAQVDQPPQQGSGEASTSDPQHTGSFIEWVQEDDYYWFREIKEDISSQVPSDVGTDEFTLSYKNLSAGRDARPARTVDIRVQVNEKAVHPIEVNASTGWIKLGEWVPPGSSVEAYYSVDYIPEEEIGLHFLQIQADRVLSRRLLGQVEREILVSPYAGELEFDLSHQDLIPGSVRIVLPHFYPLEENTHYIVDYSNGKITITAPDQIPPYDLYISYNWAGEQVDDIPFESGQSSNQIVPGAIIAFGEKVQVGSVGVVGVMKNREIVAEIFGGKWNVSMSLNCFARDPDTIQEISDWLSGVILAYLKPRLDLDGQALTDFSFGGKARTVYMEGGEEYYSRSLSFSLLTDWEAYRPLPIKFESFRLDSLITPAPFQPAHLLDVAQYDHAITALERYK